MAQVQGAEPLSFQIVFAKQGGFGLKVNGADDFEYQCSHLFELHECLGRMLQNHTNQSPVRPLPSPPPMQYMQPRVAAPPPVAARPPATPQPQEQEPPLPPLPEGILPDGSTRSLVDKIKGEMERMGNGTAGRVMAAVPLIALTIVYNWPFGA